MHQTRLFRVIIDYHTNYFVLAKDFNEAAIKAKEAYLHEKNTKSILTNDGSLNLEKFEFKIQNIEFLTDNVLL